MGPELTLEEMLEDGVLLHDHKTDKVMQFTGLKDKNGKEIYEGDIIENGIAGRCKVEFISETSDGRPLCEISAHMENGYRDYIHTGCEVIGNVYENPDLLK